MLLGQLVGIGALAEVLHALLRVGIEPLVAVLIDDGLRDILHVRACVARLGHLNVAAQQLLVTHGHRLAEVVHLRAGVVDVELFEHVVARMAHNARRGIAQSGPAAMTHVQGTGGVRRDVLEVDLALALRDLAFAEVVLFGARRSHDALQDGVRQTNVDEAGAGDVDGSDHVVLGQVVDDDLSDLARILLGKLCRTHGDGGRPVAVALVARALESRLGSLLERERSVLARGRDGRVDQLFKLFANLHGTHLSLADGSFVYTSHDSTMFPSVWGTQPPRVSLERPLCRKHTHDLG